MATKIYKPLKPLNEFIGDWMAQTEDDLQQMFQVQKIYPLEVYKGWLKENARRKRYAMKHPEKDVWYSTGQGVKSIQARVIRANSPSDIAVGISHLEHMKFADMGVNAWEALGDVDTAKKARYNSRYISSWIPSMGKTHRPGIMYKARGLQARMANYLADFYGQSAEIRFLQATSMLEEPFEIFNF